MSPSAGWARTDPMTADTTFALVRPDGFLAARGVGNEVDKVMDYLRLFLGRTDANPSRSGTTALAVGIQMDGG